MGGKESKSDNQNKQTMTERFGSLCEKAESLKRDLNALNTNLFPKEELNSHLKKIQDENAVCNDKLFKLLEVSEEQQFALINLETKQIQLFSLQEDQEKLIEDLTNNWDERFSLYEKKLSEIKSNCGRLEDEHLESMPCKGGSILPGSKKIKKNSYDNRINRDFNHLVKSKGMLKEKLQKARLERWLAKSNNKENDELLISNTNVTQTTQDSLDFILFDKGENPENIQNNSFIYCKGKQFDKSMPTIST